MAWYRGVDCKTCKCKVALKGLTGPEEGPFDPCGPTEWIGAGIICRHCGQENYYSRADFIVFETLEPMPGDPSEVRPERKPN